MQKVKRKGNTDESPSAKKKKVQFAPVESEKKITKTKHVDTPKKVFQKGKPEKNVGKKFGKQNGDGPKKDFKKGSKDFKKGPYDFKKGPKDNSQTEKPKWSEMKKEKKELRLVRRKTKATAPVFEISHKAKLLAAQIQRKVVQQEFRNNSCKELHIMLKGQYKNVALTHDLSRVIQVLLKHSNEDIKSEITEELLDIMVQMMQSKYAHHAVKRIIKYGTDFIRHEVIKKLFGSIVSLATHSISAPVLDYAYGEFATQKEKLFMQQEFYGDIYKNTKDEKVKTLNDTYKNSPEMKAAILSSCKVNIQKILDKNLHDGELLHSVLYDYIRECSADDRAELISTLSPLLVPLSNSLPGANAASMCVWQGTNKDKKTILKVVKEHAVALSTHKTGYRLLLAIFDSVDDTVLVKKAIVSTLANSVKDIAKDHWGKMTLHWLVKPNDKVAFHPNLINFLKEGAKSGTSKKDADIRVSELLEGILPALHKEIESDPEFWISEPNITFLTTAILSIASSKEMLNGISKAICRTNWTLKKDNEDVLAIEDAGMHMCLKKMAALDKDQDGYTLGEAISEHLTKETLETWLPTNRGCFFVLKLIENNKQEVADKLKVTIKPLVQLLKQQTTQGAKLLLQSIK